MDIKSWTDHLGKYDTPFLNYVQKMEMAWPNHAAAIIGHTKPSHPRLARLLVHPVRALFRASAIALHAAGYTEAESDPYDECDCEVKASGGGLAGLAQRLGSIRQEWSKTEPIYDPEKVKQIDKEFNERHPRRTMTWGPATFPQADD